MKAGSPESYKVMLEEARDTGEIIERVAALDIGKVELACCVRVPDGPAAWPVGVTSPPFYLLEIFV